MGNAIGELLMKASDHPSVQGLVNNLLRASPLPQSKLLWLKRSLDWF